MNDEALKKVKDVIIDIESNSRVRMMVDNEERIKGYYEIGRLLVEAQGGASRAKYGDNLIKKWGEKLAKEYGKNYSRRNLELMRKFYLEFPIAKSLISQLSWTQIVLLLPIKNENERNYYINQVILNNLSVRELRNEIKNKSFERLSYTDKNNIKLITDINNNSLTIEDMIKDPIIIETDQNELDEATIHRKLINGVENRFLELGIGFALVGHEYKLKVNNKTYRIDLLFFNIKFNAYVVVEIKSKEIKPEDIGQLQFYVSYIDKYVKENSNNKTIGILIVKKKNKLVIEFTTNIYVTTYNLVNKNYILRS